MNTINRQYNDTRTEERAVNEIVCWWHEVFDFQLLWSSCRSSAFSTICVYIFFVRLLKWNVYDNLCAWHKQYEQQKMASSSLKFIIFAYCFDYSISIYIDLSQQPANEN